MAAGQPDTWKTKEAGRADVAETTCRIEGCNRGVDRHGRDGMCSKCAKRDREIRLALGLWESRRDRAKAEPKPRKRGPQGYKRDGYAKDFPDCIVDNCPSFEGKQGGEGRCRKHFEEYRAECVAKGEQCPMTNRQREQWEGILGFHIEDWPEDQHAGLSIDGKCSVPWGCDVDISQNPKTGRGLCGRHFQQWVNAYKRRGRKVPKRQHGNPHRYTRMPSDDVIVETMKRCGSFRATSKALGVSEGTFRDYYKIRPELEERLNEVWRLVHKPRQFSDEERVERAREQSRRNNLKRRLVSKERLEHSDLTEADAVKALEYSLHLETQPCTYCKCYFPGKMQIDHIVAVTRGGAVTWENLASSCAPCNGSKSDRDLDEFLAASVEVRAARYAAWCAQQELAQPESEIEVLAIETGTTLPVSTSPEQLCLAFPGETLTTSGDANAGPRPRSERAGRER